MANAKLSKIRGLMKEKQLDAVMLSNQSNYAWLSDGGRGHVAMASESSVGSFFVTNDEVFLITNNIEAKRLQEEELSNLDCKLKEHFWFDNAQKDKIIDELCKDKKIGSDMPMNGAINIASAVAELRYILTDSEVEHYKELGKNCGEAIGKVCKLMKPGLSEFDIAGIMASELYSREITPIVLLIAVDDRIERYRHPLPTNKRVNKYGMIVICGRKYGLVASVTRLFHFGKMSDELRRKHNAVVEVDTVFISESRPNAIIGDIFAKAQQMYTDKGFPGEWQFHHQGGPAGYAPRDYVATPNNTGKVLKPQALAWNPSIKGTKSEDTIITTDGKPDIITTSPDFPMISVQYNNETWQRPDIIVL
ncbi:TPA: M24 family metallopeptidase [bacterium]|nr:M24 family metallopeptidase [bacterium]